MLNSFRSFCGDLIETKLKNFPPGAVKFRRSQLFVSFDMVLSHYRATNREIFFLQVGAHDGISGDAIFPMVQKHGLRGILVEPQRRIFGQLRENYSRIELDNFLFVNAAISDHDGSAVLYQVRPSAQGPEWLTQLASFDRSVIMKHSALVPGLESLIESVEVPCMTFATLFKEMKVQEVNVLQVDTEGYDAEILRLYDVPMRRPAIVRFEHKHLRPTDHEQALKILVDAGYLFTICGENTLAYLI
jgi:FkbM family methyltransferase